MSNTKTPLIIGLTGNIASGKSFVGDILREQGIPVIDSDDIVHELYASDSKVQAEILKIFGSLDRRQIAREVFGQDSEAAAKRRKLEAIVHPAVDQKLREWIAANANHPILVNLVPLLFEAALEHRYDKIVTIITDPVEQKLRLKKRNPELSEQEINKRLNSQMPQDLKAEKSDYVLKNNGSLESLRKQVKALLKNL
jgi:dephospho-CoA kinase